MVRYALIGFWIQEPLPDPSKRLLPVSLLVSTPWEPACQEYSAEVLREELRLSVKNYRPGPQFLLPAGACFV